MSTSDRPANPRDPERPVNEFLAYAELLTAPKLARLYTYVLRTGPVPIEAVKDDLQFPHSTTYKYVGELEEMGVLKRHADESPTTISVEPICLRLKADHGEVRTTPALVDAIGRQLETEDIRVFVERQGIPKLAAALHYTLRVRAGELTQRTAAERLGVHPAEAMTVITALQDVAEEAADYDPYLDPVR